jgi:CHAD domain-containing protein
MAYCFKKNEAIPAAIRRVFVEEIDAAVGHLIQSKDRIKAVHEARKSVKKIRGLLAIIRTPLGPLYASEDRLFRNIGRKLSEARDTDVTLEVFDALAAKHPGADTAKLRESLLVSKIQPVDVPVARLLRAARGKASLWPLEGLAYESLLSDILETYRGGRKAHKKLAKEHDEESSHDLRKKAKEHWYHLRLVDAYVGKELRERAKSLHDLETWLGDEHNLAVLRQRLQANVETAADRRLVRAFVAHIDQEAQELSKRALLLAHELYGSKPHLFAQQITPSAPARVPAQSTSQVLRPRSYNCALRLN